MTLGVERKSARHVDALTLAAGELVRVALKVLDVEADLLHKVKDLLLALRRVGLGAMDDHRLLDGSGSREARVKTRVGVLEDHLDVLVHGLALGTLELGNILALEQDLAARGGVQARDAAAQRRLAAARLADDAQGLALEDVKANVRQGVQGLGLAKQSLAAELELLAEVLDAQNDVVLAQANSPPRGRASARRSAYGTPRSGRA